jgi:hypothetical protein
MVQDRFLDLLAARATEGLGPEEQAELERLLRQVPDVQPNELEPAAVAVELAATAGRTLEPMPEDLASKIQQHAVQYFGFKLAPEAPAPTADVLAFPAPATPARRRGGFWLGLAASLATASLGWWFGRSGGPVPQPLRSLSSIELAQAAAAQPDSLSWAFEAPGGANPALTGKVAWNGRLQAGLMRFRGLPANDPTREQYQLWIFDEAQDERYPVDGGVFDVPAGAVEALIPIQAKLKIDRPKLFAVTIEKPGGVVVSSRERIAALATG